MRREGLERDAPCAAQLAKPGAERCHGLTPVSCGAMRVGNSVAPSPASLRSVR